MIKLMPLNFPKRNIPKMKVYLSETEPVIEYYRNQGILRDIDGALSIDDVAKSMEDAIR